MNIGPGDSAALEKFTDPQANFIYSSLISSKGTRQSVSWDGKCLPKIRSGSIVQEYQGHDLLGNEGKAKPRRSGKKIYLVRFSHQHCSNLSYPE